MIVRASSCIFVHKDPDDSTNITRSVIAARVYPFHMYFYPGLDRRVPVIFPRASQCQYWGFTPTFSALYGLASLCLVDGNCLSLISAHRDLRCVLDLRLMHRPTPLPTVRDILAIPGTSSCGFAGWHSTRLMLHRFAQFVLSACERHAPNVKFCRREATRC